MHTIVETETFTRRAKAVGLTDAEIEIIIDVLAHYPTIGDEIGGTGGARKVRFPGRGKGKRGGYRVITFYSGVEVPLFLLDVFAKSDKVNLTQKEKNDLKDRLKSLLDAYRSDRL